MFWISCVLLIFLSRCLEAYRIYSIDPAISFTLLWSPSACHFTSQSMNLPLSKSHFCPRRTFHVYGSSVIDLDFLFRLQRIKETKQKHWFNLKKYYWTMSYILLTGGAGYIGVHCVVELVNAGEMFLWIFECYVLRIEMRGATVID